MKELSRRFVDFFFTPVSASGFGLMRIGWASVVLGRMLLQWPDVVRYYSGSGLLSPEFDGFISRQVYRFSLLVYVQDPTMVLLLYFALLIACLCMLIGLWPRVSTVIAAVLLFSFHERNIMILGGGDTVLRVVALPLCLSTGTRAFSIPRLREQWAHWWAARAFLPPLTMHAWTLRLHTWQMILIYVTAAWDKSLGTMWRIGSAVTVALHHPHFSLLPRWVQDLTAPLSPLLGYAALLYEATWSLLLLPSRLFRRIPFLRHGGLRRLLLAGGIVFHGMIWLTMDVGSFSPALFVGFLGLLHAEDFIVLRRWFNRHWQGNITVFYDSACRLCTRSMFVMHLLDVLHRLHPVDFRDPLARRRAAPHLLVGDLDRSMHILLPDGRVLKGFRAFRALAHHLPPLWPVVPFLYLPGAALLGEMIYRDIAANRNRCADEGCRHRPRKTPARPRKSPAAPPNVAPPPKSDSTGQ